MSGGTAHCPTCGLRLTIPFIDPASGLPLPAPPADPTEFEDPTPLHAYAASGALAPQIIRRPDGTAVIACAGCGAENEMDADRCTACGAPFTLEAAPTGSGSHLRAVELGAVTLGSIGLASVYLPFLLLPAVLGMVLGIRACADSRRGLSWLGVLGAALGFVGLSGGVIGFALL
jgi:hypothetical protein